MISKDIGNHLGVPIICVDAINGIARVALLQAIELCLSQRTDVNLRFESGVTIKIEYDRCLELVYQPLLDQATKAERDYSKRVEEMKNER